jgi:large subunit ribosomal protein L33
VQAAAAPVGAGDADTDKQHLRNIGTASREFLCAPCPYWQHRRAARSRHMPREKIILGCTECKNRNYFTMKNKRLHPERVEWKKYCPRCNKHQLHKETK